MTVRARLFDADRDDHEIELGSSLPDIGQRQLLWVDVEAEDEERLAELGSLFRLTDDTVGLLKEPSATPRITAFPEYVHVTVLVLPDASGEKPKPLDLVAGLNFVLTVHDGPVDLLNDFDDRIRGDTHLGELDAPSFLAALLNGHITSYFRVADEIEGTIDRIDARALHPRSQGDLLEELVRVRQRIARVRRSITPHREVLAALSGPDMKMIAESDSSEHYQALVARLERAIETVENSRELLIGSFDIFMSRTAKRTNDTMKVLALASVILLPASVLAGIMGMNFKVDLFESADNFLFTLVGMGLIALAVLGRRPTSRLDLIRDSVPGVASRPRFLHELSEFPTVHAIARSPSAYPPGVGECGRDEPASSFTSDEWARLHRCRSCQGIARGTAVRPARATCGEVWFLRRIVRSAGASGAAAGGRT